MRISPVSVAAAVSMVSAAFLGAACGGSAAAEPKSAAPTVDPPIASASVVPPQVRASVDAPEISRSVGAPGGVVLLWPRVEKGAGDSREIAARIQKRLASIVARALPGRALDVRPEPERACPRAGCSAIAVGAVLSRSGGGCAVAALVSAPGTSPFRIIPWAGKMNLRNASVPFRQPPEQEISVEDYQSCGDVDGDLAANESDVLAAIRSAGK